MYLIFRGLFFERNADIGRKSHLWMGTNYPVDWKKGNVLGIKSCREEELSLLEAFEKSPILAKIKEDVNFNLRNIW